MDSVYEGKNYKIVKDIKKNPDPIEWESNSIAMFCNLLISERDEKIRKDFFTTPLYDKLQKINPSRRLSLPTLFLDPYCSKAASTFNPTTISKSKIFLYIRDYADDNTGNYQQFLKMLTDKQVILKNKLKLIKCCRSVTLGEGEKCSLCGKKAKKIYLLYHFSDGVVRVLLEPGKIIEGVVYHSLKNQLEKKSYSIHPNLYLKSKIKSEESPEFDLDTVIIDNRKTKALAILSSIRPGKENERKQVEALKKFKVPTLFITTGSSNKTQELEKIGVSIIKEVHKIKDIEKRISEEAQSFF